MNSISNQMLRVCIEKVSWFCGWTELASAQLWVHLKSVSDGLALLVLLQIGANKITVRSVKEAENLNTICRDTLVHKHWKQ